LVVEAILAVADELELRGKNRVNLWRLRSTNPCGDRIHVVLESNKAKASGDCLLFGVATVVIRQLLLAYQQMTEKQIPLEQNLRLSNYLERFKVHFRSRMNPTV